MTPICAVILKNEKGEFRVGMMGQPNDHLMNWRGCNYHYVALPKELRKKFTSYAEAAKYEKEVDQKLDTDKQFRRYFEHRSGTYLKDELLAVRSDYE